MNKEIDSWQSTLADLHKRRNEAEAKLEKFVASKKPLTLGAHTGDEKAAEKLAAINAEIVIAQQANDDIGEAIVQAEEKLATAERKLAAEQKAKRLRSLSARCDDRVTAASAVEQAVEALSKALSVYEAAGTNALRYIDPHDDATARRIDGGGRLRNYLGGILGRQIDGLPVNHRDPRRGKGLADLEREYLSPLMLTDIGADKMAGEE